MAFQPFDGVGHGSTCSTHFPTYNPSLQNLNPFRVQKRLEWINAGVAQWLEHHVANVNVEGSNPFTRSLFPHRGGTPLDCRSAELLKSGFVVNFMTKRPINTNRIGYNVEPDRNPVRLSSTLLDSLNSHSSLNASGSDEHT